MSDAATGDDATVSAAYADYAADRADPRFTDWCRERTGESWTAATDHRFTRELHADTLDDDVFRRYLVQDYAVVESLVGAFGHAVGEAPSMAAKSRLVEFLGTVTGDEDDYFERSFDALGVPESTHADPPLAEPTAAFQDLIGRATGRGGYAETLAVLVPAEWVYLTWASGHDERPDRFYLAEWVDLHAVDAFAEFVGWLRRELDREGAAANPRRQARIADLFARTVDLEAAFFDAAYDGDRSLVPEQATEGDA
ncbi:TenA family protein [Haloarcula litorea]|uniref:TenA family protein n=1 Tax=Haloarcula litorea TaxID=3032579 RepID=UPI0023E82230|nr:TenA family protein [Halomicroarcula sp. GDY20]